mmetsp:Transcript_15261/g.40985  ORF Transcript_15261/g.40985 Transcript_15261/m.40985 type:complete len:219 (+) Transcript_15261:718-1374(+)
MQTSLESGLPSCASSNPALPLTNSTTSWAPPSGAVSDATASSAPTNSGLDSSTRSPDALSDARTATVPSMVLSTSSLSAPPAISKSSSFACAVSHALPSSLSSRGPDRCDRGLGLRFACAESPSAAALASSSETSEISSASNAAALFTVSCGRCSALARPVRPSPRASSRAAALPPMFFRSACTLCRKDAASSDDIFSSLPHLHTHTHTNTCSITFAL